MKASQMLDMLNKPALVWFEQLKVACVIVDAKSSYGNVNILVRPIEGEGEQWVSEARIVKVLTSEEVAA